MERKVILVTGASGFIGTNLTGWLLEKGCAVIALDIAKPRLTYFGYRYASELGTDAADFDVMTITGDIRDRKLLMEIFQYKIHYVVHLAALSTIQLGAVNCGETMDVNVGGTEALLRAAEASGGVRGFLFASTDKVYGNLKAQAYSEEDALSPLQSPYDLSKADADKLVRSWSKEHGLHGIVLRFCNIYGKHDLHATRIIPAAIRAALEKQSCVLRVYLDEEGNMQSFRRDFLYAEDLCDAIWNIIKKLDGWDSEAAAKPGVWGEAFNLGSGHCYPMDEIITKIQKIIGAEQSPHIEISKEFLEISQQRMDFSKAHKVFGFTPRISLEEGLQETVTWWRQQYRNEGPHDKQSGKSII